MFGITRTPFGTSFGWFDEDEANELLGGNAELGVVFEPINPVARIEALTGLTIDELVAELGIGPLGDEGQDQGQGQIAGQARTDAAPAEFEMTGIVAIGEDGADVVLGTDGGDLLFGDATALGVTPAQDALVLEDAF